MKTSFLSSFLYSASFIFISDITDKSIFLIIFLSKKLPIIILFIVSLISVLLMNYLSILVGFLLPKLISNIEIQMFAFIFFIIFGILSLIESWKNDDKIDALKNLEKIEINIPENDYSLISEEFETDIESNKEILSPSILRNNSITSNISNTNENINFGFIMTIFFALCLSDFGDKSQITIVTMAAIYNIYGIILGSTIALIGTVTLAVLFGKLITEKISPKRLLFIGGLIFLVFGGEALYNIYNNC